MAVNVSPTADHPTHDLSLSNGTTTIGLMLCNGRGEHDPTAMRQSGNPRTTLRISQGDPDYSSQELPYFSITQKDFSGGRGLDDFSKDTTRYYDGEKVDTTKADLILAPGKTLTSFDLTKYATGAATDYTIYVLSPRYFSFTPNTNLATRKIGVFMSWFLDSRALSTLKIYSDSSGNPGSLLGTSNPTEIVGTGAGAEYEYTFDAAVSLVSGTKYWINLSQIAANLKIGTLTGSGQTVKDWDGSTWVTAYSNVVAALVVYQSGGTGTIRLFEYKGAVYGVSVPDDGSAPLLLENGYRGAATSNSADKSKLNTTLNLAGVNLTGKIAYITGGTGSTEPTPWRLITSNTQTGTNDSITVSPSWVTTHDTTTEFVILGCDTFREITGHGMTKTPTDVLQSRDLLLFAFNEDANLRKGNAYNNAGTWTWRWTDDGTNKAYRLLIGPDDKVWKANNQAASVSVASAAPRNYDATAHAFGTAIVCGSHLSKIRDLLNYGDPLSVYIVKEDGFGYISGTSYLAVPLGEMKAVKDSRNGTAVLHFGTYLYFSLLNGLERYMTANNRLDDVGPNLGEGLPKNRQGTISALIGYPGRFYAAIDAGIAGYSSILCSTNDGADWHEIYRADYGKRIRSLFIQPMPGTTIDRLWFAQDMDIYWLPIAPNARKADGYLYQINGKWVSSWITGGMQEIPKYWHRIKVFAENLATDAQYVTVEYQTDNEGDSDAWHTIVDGAAAAVKFQTSPESNALISLSRNVTGKRIRFRLTLNTTDTSKTPRVKAITAEGVLRMPVKNSWQVTFKVEDGAVDRNGNTEDASAQTLFGYLRSFAESSETPAPLLMRHVNALFDNTYVFIDPLTLNVTRLTVDPNRITTICSMVVYEA